MSHLKYGSDRLGAAPRVGIGSRLCPVPFALLLAMQAFSAQAELYFNPRFSPTILPQWRICRISKRVRRCRRAPIASISI
jgi:hypothetical protein